LIKPVRDSLPFGKLRVGDFRKSILRLRKDLRLKIAEADRDPSLRFGIE
jgi:hypothetical protein